MAFLDPDLTVLFTGAGISLASGLPVYRGAGGLYDDGVLPPLRRSDLAPRRLPSLWAHVDALEAAALAADPNPAHLAIAAFASAGTVTVTQNVDALHARAGGAGSLVELHGRLGRVRCLGHDHVGVLDATQRGPDGVPRCPVCTSRCRPDVVLFGERLPSPALRAARTAIRACAVIVAVGTSASVFPAAALPDLAPRALRLWVNPAAPPPDDGWTWAGTDAVGDLPSLLAGTHLTI